MTVQVTHKGRDVIKIMGNLRNKVDCDVIKEAVNQLDLQENELLTLEIVNSIIMPSVVIGYLLKLRHQSPYRLQINIHQPSLYALLTDLKLIEILNVRYCH